jgi:hypothetical protein
MSDPIRPSVEQVIAEARELSRKHSTYCAAIDEEATRNAMDRDCYKDDFIAIAVAAPRLIKGLLAALQAAEQAQAEAERERERDTRPTGWQWHHERENDLIGRDGWMCEQHPGREFPHDDCAGPGRSWVVEGKAAIQAFQAERDEAVALLRNIAPVTTRVEDSYRAFAWLKAYDARRCPCHLGSVCDVACTHGRHHDGCPAESGTVARHPTPEGR